MKVDKETLIKHQFWIGLGVFVPLVLFTLFWLGDATQAETEKKKQELDKHLKTLADLEQNRPKRKNDWNQLELLRVQLEKRKEEIWEKAWKMQEDLLSWPADPELEKLSKLKFGTELKDQEGLRIRANYARKDIYDPQIEQLANMFRTKVIAGKDERIFDAVEFKGGWKKVLTYVKDWQAKGKPPSSEEIWLAQEDIWLQRELLKALLEANSTVAKFQKIEGPAAGANELYRQQFRNNEWELDLIVFQNKAGKYGLRGKIKNVSGKPNPIGLIFYHVQLHGGGAQPVVLPVQGDTLPADKELAIPDHILDLANRPDGLYGVTQLFEGRTGPIRRIDQIVIGGQSHRTYYPRLLMAKFSREEVKDLAAKAANPQPGVKPPDLSRTELYEVLRERYAVTTEQVRRIPVAVVLLADQAHIQEILVALTNSKFRFQVTQVGWQRYRGSAAAEEPPPPARAGDPKKENAEDVQANLVELVIYCVASIYEKYEPAPAGRDVTAGGKRPPKIDKDKDKDKDAPMPKSKTDE
jgi:hypothetical protein